MKDIIESAIAFEKEGVALYNDLEQKAGNALVRRLFASLKKQEEDHINYIQAYTRSKKFKPMEYIPLEEQIREVYEGEKEAVEHTELSDLEGYALALKLENKGYGMYVEAFEHASNKEDREFFKFLMNMEQEHYEALANVYYYLSHNDQWLAENESETWSWMNT